jgi:hypothetical protein
MCFNLSFDLLDIRIGFHTGAVNGDHLQSFGSIGFSPGLELRQIVAADMATHRPKIHQERLSLGIT